MVKQTWKNVVVGRDTFMQEFFYFILCRLHSTDDNIVKLIGTSLHNLEELFLYYIMVSYLKSENLRAIECLVAGCPKLKILHMNWICTPESLQYLLLGLPNLIEFKHRDMVSALAQIIQKGRADRVSAIRNLYYSMEYPVQCHYSDTYDFKLLHMVMNNLYNITMLDITIPTWPSEMSLTAFSVTVSNMTNLTELTMTEQLCKLLPIIEAIGHQLKLLDWSCLSYPSLEVISQCRKLRVLRLTVLSLGLGCAFRYFSQYPSYGSDLQEEFTAFQHLQELHLNKLLDTNFKSALIKSLIASPVLRDLKLVLIPIVTDHIVKAAVNHINQDGEQLAFTSLRRLELEYHTFHTNYLMDIVSHDRVPLEVLVLNKCSKIVELNLGRFTVKTICDKDTEYYSCY